MNYRRKKVLRAFNAAEETSSDHTLHRHHPKKRSLGMLFPSQSEPPEEELFPEAESSLLALEIEANSFASLVEAGYQYSTSYLFKGKRALRSFFQKVEKNEAPWAAFVSVV